MPTKYLLALKELSYNSYSPYSKFKVAAIVVVNDDILIKGVNIENIAYGEAICAERTALTQAYTQGYLKKDLQAIHIYSSNGATPCGACRQVMSELLLPEGDVFIYSETQLIKQYKNKDLLPDSFYSIA